MIAVVIASIALVGVVAFLVGRSVGERLAKASRTREVAFQNGYRLATQHAVKGISQAAEMIRQDTTGQRVA